MQNIFSCCCCGFSFPNSSYILSAPSLPNFILPFLFVSHKHTYMRVHTHTHTIKWIKKPLKQVNKQKYEFRSLFCADQLLLDIRPATECGQSSHSVGENWFFLSSQVSIINRNGTCVHFLLSVLRFCLSLNLPRKSLLRMFSKVMVYLV